MSADHAYRAPVIIDGHQYTHTSDCEWDAPLASETTDAGLLRAIESLHRERWPNESSDYDPAKDNECRPIIEQAVRAAIHAATAPEPVTEWVGWEPVAATAPEPDHEDDSAHGDPRFPATAPESGTDPRAALERAARLQDALDCLDMAALWLHRSADFPHMPSHQAESWERKARSARVAIRAALSASGSIDAERLARAIANGAPLDEKDEWWTSPRDFANAIAERYARLSESVE